MRGGDEAKSLHQAYRPVADTIIGPDSRLRHPAVQQEVELRVDIYANQVERNGRIKWLPRRGSGKSARERRVERRASGASAACADECLRVLGESE